MPHSDAQYNAMCFRLDEPGACLGVDPARKRAIVGVYVGDVFRTTKVVTPEMAVAALENGHIEKVYQSPKVAMFRLTNVGRRYCIAVKKEARKGTRHERLYG